VKLTVGGKNKISKSAAAVDPDANASGFGGTEGI